MRKREKEAIIISFLKEKEKYESFADYLIRLIWDDPSAPKENLHTLTYRIKDKTRLIEKIERENKKSATKSIPITHQNFQNRVGDLLGIRLICLRLSDIKRIETYLELLVEEKILKFIQEPKRKRSFILPVDPDEAVPAGIDLRYSGYSSIHYQVMLGENSDAAEDLKELQVELQLRTILEEAWGEIDHKYRYVHSRTNHNLPEYIHTGFYNLSVYLQVAALQAEHLCRQAESFGGLNSRTAEVSSRVAENNDPDSKEARKNAYNQKKSQAELQINIEKTLGFKLTERTFTYILKRLDEQNIDGHIDILFDRVFTVKRQRKFIRIVNEINGRKAFEDKGKRNVDAINAVNFALADEFQGKRVAEEGLKAVLKWRERHSR